MIKKMYLCFLAMVTIFDSIQSIVPLRFKITEMLGNARVLVFHSIINLLDNFVITNDNV